MFNKGDKVVVVDRKSGLALWTGAVKYLTPDGWAGVVSGTHDLAGARLGNGRLDEVAVENLERR